MFSRVPHNPGPYDDDFENQPTYSAYHKWFLGVAAPVGLIALGVYVLVRRDIDINLGRVEFTGPNAAAIGVAIVSLGLFLHAHFFWGNLFDQHIVAVLAKIAAGLGFIGSLGFLLIRNGVLGMN